jgi:hypothetical protein
VRIFALLLLGGCDLAWGLKPFADAGPDTPPIDAAPDAETCFTFDEIADADVVMIDSTGNPGNQGHGTEPIVNVGVGIKSEGLLRYPAPALMPGDRIAKVRFVGPFVTSSHVCGTAGACGPCMSLAQPGTFSVAYATSQWDEAVACFNFPTTAGTWQVTGARGDMDRSAVAGLADLAAGADLAIDLDPTDAAAWIQNGLLSVVVTPSAGGVTILPQKQYASGDGTCNASQAGTKLTFTVCR